MNNNYRILIIFLISLMAACAVQKPNIIAALNAQGNAGELDPIVNGGLVTPNATAETAALYYNMKALAKDHIMFGHMEDNQTGYDGWLNTPGRSDVQEVTGAYPAVYGFDFGRLVSFRPDSVTEKDADAIRNEVFEAYQRKGVITFSWHYNNPVSKGSFYWKQSPVSAVNKILYNPKYNKIYNHDLKTIARFATSLKYKGKLVPVIFRPFHEFDGDWFWWGRTHCTVDEYKLLYRYTVTYLRDQLHVTNFIYAWSPDCNYTTTEKYIERYPGDQYVDVVGTDDYYDLRMGQSPLLAADKFKIVADFAAGNKKVAALTETGLENLPQANWYTAMLLQVLKANATHLAYVMVWANHPKSFWTPYKGHPAEQDFINFKNDPYILFGDKMPDMYQILNSK